MMYPISTRFSDIPLLSLGSGMIFDLLIRWLNMMKHQASQFSSVIASHPWRSVKAVCQAFGPSDTRRTEKFSCLKCLDSGKMASLPPFGGKTRCFFSFTRSSTLLALGIAGGSWWCEANRGKWSGRKCRGQGLVTKVDDSGDLFFPCWLMTWICQQIWKLRNLRGLQCYSLFFLFGRDYRCDKLDRNSFQCGWSSGLFFLSTA